MRSARARSTMARRSRRSRSSTKPSRAWPSRWTRRAGTPAPPRASRPELARVDDEGLGDALASIADVALIEAAVVVGRAALQAQVALEEVAVFVFAIEEVHGAVARVAEAV